MARSMSSLLALCALLVASGALAQPRLVLVLVLDGVGSDQLLQGLPNMQRGVGPLIKAGAFYPNVRYGHAKVATASGHATLSTGAHPSAHGIVGNDYIDRSTGRPSPIFADRAYPVLGVPPSVQDASPSALEAQTLADRLKLATGGDAQVVAIGTKARSTLAMAGRLGRAYWYAPTTGRFVTGTFYEKALPGWLKSFNALAPSDAYFGEPWNLAMPESRYRGDDDRPYESDLIGMGRTFPHPTDAGLREPGTSYYQLIPHTPVADELVAEAAHRALEETALGRDAVPDLLAVAFSGADLAHHYFGPSSWEAQDTLARLDRAVAKVVATARRVAGRNNVLVVLTSDHGFARIPESWMEEGQPARRLDPDALASALEETLEERFGASGLVRGVMNLDLYLDDARLAERGLEGALVRRAAAAWLGAQEGIAVAVARDDLDRPSRSPLVEALARGYFAGRSGDVLFVPEAHNVLTRYEGGTDHGTPYSYDALVPLILQGRGVRRGTFHQAASAVDVAPTLSALLGITPPSQAEGRVLHEALD